MSTQQPEALRLADELEDSLESHDGSSLTARCQGIADDAAAELRRLHTENTTLQQGYDAARLEIKSLQAQLEAVGAGGVEPLRKSTAQDAEDAARLDWMIEQRAYVVSDPDACPGYWLQYARPDGSTWAQCGEHPTPRAAIDAARDLTNEGDAA